MAPPSLGCYSSIYHLIPPPNNLLQHPPPTEPGNITGTHCCPSPSWPHSVFSLASLASLSPALPQCHWVTHFLLKDLLRVWGGPCCLPVQCSLAPSLLMETQFHMRQLRPFKKSMYPVPLAAKLGGMLTSPCTASGRGSTFCWVPPLRPLDAGPEPSAGRGCSPRAPQTPHPPHVAPIMEGGATWSLQEFGNQLSFTSSICALTDCLSQGKIPRETVLLKALLEGNPCK